MNSSKPATSFHAFEVSFNEPSVYSVNCIKILRQEPQNSFTAYLGIEKNSSALLRVYEWRISLEKYRIFEEKRLEACETEVISSKAENFRT